jgi:hypothetical protein
MGATVTQTGKLATIIANPAVTTAKTGIHIGLAAGVKDHGNSAVAHALHKKHKAHKHPGVVQAATGLAAQSTQAKAGAAAVKAKDK